MVQYTSIQTLTGGIIKTQWYANGIPVTADEVPQSVKDKCCDCGCGEGGGSSVDTNFATNDLTFTGDRIHDGAGFKIRLENFKEIALSAADSVSAQAKDNKVEIKENNEVNFNQFTDARNDTDQNSFAWFDKDGNLKRTNLVDSNLENRHVPKPLISRNYNKELINKSTQSISNFTTSNIVVKIGKNPTVPVIYFDGNDPNQATTFIPDYQKERGVIYKELGGNPNFWKYDNNQYTVFDEKFTYDDIANQGVIWLSAAVESGQDMSFFVKNKPMLIVEVYNSKTKRSVRHRTSNNDYRFKKWQTWNFKNDEFENLNRPLNTKETGSNGFNQKGDGNGFKYFASQWDFTPTKHNSEMLFRLDVHALFGSPKTSNVPEIFYPVPLIDTYTNGKYTPRCLNQKGNTGVKTSYRQPIRFRFACIDPQDERNLLYSEPTKTFMLGLKSGQFIEDNYVYQFVIKEVNK